MPTTRPRHPVTETDDIAAVLDEAARRWPDVPRSRLIPLVLHDWASGGASPRDRDAALRAPGRIAPRLLRAVRPGRGLAGVIVADASWVIALRDPANVHYRAATAVVDTVAGEERWLHQVTLAECLVGPARAGLLEPAAAAADRAGRGTHPGLNSDI